MMPGIDPEATLVVADDRLRLDTERDIDLLRGQLIETVARRAAFIGRARGSAKKNDVQTVRQLFGEIDRLPSAEDYQSQVNKIRVLALEDARRRKDRLAERRIDELCQKTNQLIDQYLPDDRIRTVREEIDAVLSEHKLIQQVKDAPPPKAAKKPAPAAPGARPAVNRKRMDDAGSAPTRPPTGL